MNGSQEALVIFAVIVGILAFAWKNRKEAGDSPQFTLVMATFLVASLLTMPLYPLFNQLLLILPVMIVLRDWASLRTAARYTFIAILGWPSIMSLALLLLFSRGSYPPGLMPLLPAVAILTLPFILPLLLVSRHRT